MYLKTLGTSHMAGCYSFFFFSAFLQELKLIRAKVPILKFRDRIRFVNSHTKNPLFALLHYLI